MEITAEVFIFAMQLLKCDEEFEKLTPDEQYYQVQDLYKLYQESEHYKLERSSDIAKMTAYLLDRAMYCDMLRIHDYTFEYSDDQRVFDRGLKHYKEIRRIGALFNHKERRMLWNRYCPENFKQ